MKDRIKKYMDYKSISAGELATLLEVQRSNISHILNGRNMPGAAFIEKLLICFPDLNARWLLTGKGEMTADVEILTEKVVMPPKEIIKPVIKEPVIKEPVRDVTDNGKREKPIGKVVLLFEDGTFIDYYKK
jgi:transcriptional regulator with XRE-family HTH domain